MRAGFHVSIAGGIPNAVDRALEAGCAVFQIFTHSPRAWKLPEIPPEDARAFRKARKLSGISPVFVHASYLINLASADGDLRQRSVDALRAELARADMLGAEYVVTHIGSTREQAGAVVRVAEAIRAVFEGFKPKAALLLENTAGEAGDVGSSFEEIGDIIKRCGIRGLGVAFDTCHCFGAGYDLRSKEGLEDALGIMEASFGLGRLKLIHLNDSKHPLGSGRDRHEDIGKGRLGRKAFRLILNHPRLCDLPFIMETPRNTPKDDLRNMAVIRKLRVKD